MSNHYEVGERFETKDARDAGRVIEIEEILGLDHEGQKIVTAYENDWLDWELEGWASVEDAIEDTKKRHTKYRVHSEANPKNPEAIGRRSTVSENGLDTRYRKISR